ncbi:MAG: hypothetical protein ACXW31_07860 [Thermoanaerobaculia bacterium]
MLNIAGPEYDLGSVVFAVLQECEHRRRGFDDHDLDPQLIATARGKLAKIKAAYDEFGGAPSYWQSLETEVLKTAMPQYMAAAREMNALERAKFGVWRGGDPLARIAFALGGLLIAWLLFFVPFVRMFEAMFIVTFAATGFFFPDIKRWTHERRHTQLLNRLVADAAAYQQNAKLHYMTTTDIRESFAMNAPPPPSERSEGAKETTE